MAAICNNHFFFIGFGSTTFFILVWPTTAVKVMRLPFVIGQETAAFLSNFQLRTVFFSIISNSQNVTVTHFGNRS